ncbi:MMPL family transporter [Shewanella gaetbuli]
MQRIGQLLLTISAKWRFVIWLTLITCVVGYGVNLWQSGAKIQSNILAMLPHLQQDSITHSALTQVEQRLENQVYLAVVSADKSLAINSAKSIMASLKQDPNEAFIDISSADDTNINDLGKWYFEHRFQLLTPQQEQALSSNNLEQLLNQAQHQLYSAFGFANSQLITQDPLLLFPANLQALSAHSSLTQEQGILLNQQHDEYAAIIMAKGQQSAFNPNAQQAQLNALQTALATVQSPQVNILKAGALFHAKAATDSAKFEISFIGSLSLIGVVLLVWISFRTLMPLSLVFITLSSGFLFALVATLSLFQQLHLLTLVFGTSLIGIAIDYSFHFYCEKLHQPNRNATEVIQSILPAMTLALGSSSLAFIGIGFTPFPGMQQVAVFCAAGLVGAYLTIILAYPLLANRSLTQTATLKWAQQYLHALQRIAHTRRFTFVSIGIIALFIIVGVSLSTSNDDIRNLQQSPEHITQQETQVRQWLSGGADNQFILVSASSEAAVLQGLHQLQATLDQAVEQQYIQQYFSVANMLPTIAQQQRNYQLQGQIYQQQLPDIFEQLGIADNDSALSNELKSHYQAAQNHYLTVSDLLALGGNNLNSLWVQADNAATNKGQQGAIVLLTGINNLEALKQQIAQTELANANVQVVDKVGDISQLMGHYRHIMLALLAGVLVVAGVIFSMTYPLKVALAVVGIPALAILLTISSLGLLGSPLSLFHALALILVLGIGLDYSVFFAAAKQASNGVMMAVLMSACSTLLAFGLLAFSQTNAIHFFGLTLLLGIGFTFLLAPFMTLITRKQPHHV